MKKTPPRPKSHRRAAGCRDCSRDKAGSGLVLFVQKRFSGFYGFRRFNGVGAAQKKKRRGVLKYTLFTKNEKPENRQSLLSRPKSETYK